MSEPQIHLLVVDDDERIRGLLQKFLMRHGFLVTIARDAAQANVSAPRHLSMTSTAVVPFEASQVFNECAVVARKMS